MAGKSRVPEPWVSLCRLLRLHAPGNHDTRLAVWICRLAGIRIYRRGPDRACSIHGDDVPRWIATLQWHRSRPVMPRRRRRRRIC